jgi:serine/threonine protein kinase
MMAGTPGFQSPEQLRAEEVGIASDVYAFGCCFYREASMVRAESIPNYDEGDG